MWWPSGIPGYALLPARVDALAAGALLAALVREEGWVERLRQVLPRMILVGLSLLLITAIAAATLDADAGYFAPLKLRVQLIGFPAVGLLSAALVLYAVLPRAVAAGGILDRPFLRMLGKYSYALYLLHVPLRNVLVNRIFPDERLPSLLGSTILTQVLVTTSAIALTLGITIMSWNMFEKHFLKLKPRFEYRGSRVGAAASPRMADPLAAVPSEGVR